MYLYFDNKKANIIFQFLRPVFIAGFSFFNLIKILVPHYTCFYYPWDYFSIVSRILSAAKS